MLKWISVYLVTPNKSQTNPYGGQNKIILEAIPICNGTKLENEADHIAVNLRLELIVCVPLLRWSQQQQSAWIMLQ